MSESKEPSVSNFTLRAITGTVFVAAILASVVFHPLAFFLLFGIAMVLSLREFYNLAGKDGVQAQKVPGIILAIVLFVISYFAASGNLSYSTLGGVVPFIFVFFIFELYTRSVKPFHNIAYTVTGIVYIAVPFSLLNFLIFFRDNGFTPQILLGYFFILWSSDTGAYLVGRSIGKTKLFERVSPKKTWEGSIGGLVISMGIAWLISGFFQQLSLSQWLITSAIVVITGTLGDLAESLFKRSINIKDSGSILPGHGGMLDRFDALLISIPFVWFFLYFCS